MKLENLKPSSRIWVYQADRFLTEEEVQQVETAGNIFLDNWTAHGSALEAGIEVKHGCFILLAVDEQVANATGCSIDKSVHFITDLGSKLKVDFFNRMNLVVEVKGQYEILALKELEEKVNSGVVKAETTTFNNTITELASINSAWKIALSETWAARHLVFT
jgi:hypothetical protein